MRVGYRVARHDDSAKRRGLHGCSSIREHSVLSRGSSILHYHFLPSVTLLGAVTKLDGCNRLLTFVAIPVVCLCHSIYARSKAETRHLPCRTLLRLPTSDYPVYRRSFFGRRLTRRVRVGWDKSVSRHGRHEGMADEAFWADLWAIYIQDTDFLS
jgi:hypothetical protein